MKILSPPLQSPALLIACIPSVPTLTFFTVTRSAHSVHSFCPYAHLLHSHALCSVCIPSVPSLTSFTVTRSAQCAFLRSLLSPHSQSRALLTVCIPSAPSLTSFTVTRSAHSVHSFGPLSHLLHSHALCSQRAFLRSLLSPPSPVTRSAHSVHSFGPYSHLPSQSCTLLTACNISVPLLTSFTVTRSAQSVYSFSPSSHLLHSHALCSQCAFLRSFLSSTSQSRAPLTMCIPSVPTLTSFTVTRSAHSVHSFGPYSHLLHSHALCSQCAFLRSLLSPPSQSRALLTVCIPSVPTLTSFTVTRSAHSVYSFGPSSHPLHSNALCSQRVFLRSLLSPPSQSRALFTVCIPSVPSLTSFTVTRSAHSVHPSVATFTSFTVTRSVHSVHSFGPFSHLLHSHALCSQCAFLRSLLSPPSQSRALLTVCIPSAPTLTSFTVTRSAHNVHSFGPYSHLLHSHALCSQRVFLRSLLSPPSQSRALLTACIPSAPTLTSFTVSRSVHSVHSFGPYSHLLHSHAFCSQLVFPLSLLSPPSPPERRYQ